MICLKNRTFVVSTTTISIIKFHIGSCDLLEKSYLCGINNNITFVLQLRVRVVICLKNRTFVVSTTTTPPFNDPEFKLWFAWKIVPLWYQQQPSAVDEVLQGSCDLLEKAYLCGINNNIYFINYRQHPVVICLKNRTFVVSTTTSCLSATACLSCDLLEKSYLCGINNNLTL